LRFCISSFSALQRAENSSIGVNPQSAVLDSRFQCSSASRKFLNSTMRRSLSYPRRCVSVLFSEPKIPQSRPEYAPGSKAPEFQCSSASRKFLNQLANAEEFVQTAGFSALQRAENSSISQQQPRNRNRAGFSALQRAENSSIIPTSRPVAFPDREFQCSSASRKFLNLGGKDETPT